MSDSKGNIQTQESSLADSWAYAMALQAAANEQLNLTGRGLCPKGVFKFKSHEKADAWMTEMMARPPKNTGS